MFSADCGQHGVIHALRVDAHAANARAFEHAQLFRCDGIRTARFYSIFAQMRKIKVIFERRQQPCQLMLVQRGRCAAADVDALHLLARCADKRGCLLDLAAERVQIRLDEFTGLCRGCRYERAVIAPRRTERNTDVQRNIVFTDGLVHLHRGCGRADGQRRALGRNVKVLAQLDRRLAARHAALDHAARQLGRTHAGQAAPDRSLRQKRHDCVVHGRFHQFGDGALVVQRCQSGNGRALFRLMHCAVHADDRTRGGFAVLLGQNAAAVRLGELLGSVRPAQRFGRQQMKQHFLYRVFQFVIFQCIDHFPIACSIYGLYARSSFSVEMPS